MVLGRGGKVLWSGAVTAAEDLDDARIGLRTYDVTLGFRNLDERNAAVSEFSNTHVSGMAAVLAGAIKGRDVIRDARKLKLLAADVLKINPWAFDKVVRELEELELVSNLRTVGGDIVSFTESVPLLHDDVHERIGWHWREQQPTELEQQLVVSVDRLAEAPLPASVLRAEIGADARADQLLHRIGEAAELVRYHRLSDGTEIAASPLFAFERPDQLVPLFERHTPDKIREVFEHIRQQPGLPVLLGGADAIAQDMVRLGLVTAPTVKGADGRNRAFLITPYGLQPEYFTTKKQVLDKALAIIACVRCGEVSGGMTRILMPDRLLARLMDQDRGYRLGGHSSTERQYASLIRLGVIKTVPVDGLLAAELIPTADNLEAVNLARILLQRHGQALPERGNERQAAELLFTGQNYLAPIETIAVAGRAGPVINEKEFQDLWQQAMGW